MAPKSSTSKRRAIFGFDHGKAVLCSNNHQRAIRERDEVMTKDASEPKGDTEFEVQAYLWGELRKMGVNARGEVKARYAKRSWVRFDIAIFKDGKLSHIVEVKRSIVKHKTTWEDTRQGKRYGDFGVPVTIIYGMGHAEEFIKNFKQGE
jgi:hypothetical protein